MSRPDKPAASYDVHPSVAFVQAVLANLKAKTGRSAEEWAIRLRAAAAPSYVEAQYSGKKAALHPLFEGIVGLVRGLGSDIKVCPCETMVPFYRNHVFAQVKPFASRLDLGVALGDPATVQDPSGRLKDTGGFAKKDRITRRLEITREADLGIALPWLRRAYERDGK